MPKKIKTVSDLPLEKLLSVLDEAEKGGFKQTASIFHRAVLKKLNTLPKGGKKLAGRCE